MTAPILTPTVPGVGTPALAPALQLDLARGSTIGTGTWVTVFGQKSIVPGQATGTADNSDADSGIWTKQSVVSLGRTIEAEFGRNLYGAGFDPGQEELRALALSDPPVICHYRMFDRYGRTDPSEEGFAIVEWSPSGGGPQDLAKTKVTMTVQGKPTAITNPALVAVAPSLLSGLTEDNLSMVSPAVATGKLVKLVGSGFLSVKAFGAAGVKFGATNALSFTAINDNNIVANPPTTAGSQPITVTNAVGTSSSIPFVHA